MYLLQKIILFDEINEKCQKVYTDMPSVVYIRHLCISKTIRDIQKIIEAAFIASLKTYYLKKS